MKQKAEDILLGIENLKASGATRAVLLQRIVDELKHKKKREWKKIVHTAEERDNMNCKKTKAGRVT